VAGAGVGGREQLAVVERGADRHLRVHDAVGAGLDRDDLDRDDLDPDDLDPDDLVADELVVEEISIDGMCGVY